MSYNHNHNSTYIIHFGAVGGDKVNEPTETVVVESSRWVLSGLFQLHYIQVYVAL